MMNQFSVGLRTFINQILEDVCDIWRSIDIRQNNGSIRREFSQVFSGVPCRLSRVVSRRVVLSTNLPQTAIQSEAKLYFQADTNVLIGDRIKCNASKEYYEVAEVFAYPSHIECALRQVVEL